MRSKFKNRRALRSIFLMSTLLFSMALLFFTRERSVWNIWNYKILDYAYIAAVKHGHGPKASFSPQIVYLNITEGTYDHFGKHLLDRGDLAPLNQALETVGVEGIIYDIIFARASSPASDEAFADSIDQSGIVHLPVAFTLSDEKAPFQWKKDGAHERIRTDYAEAIHEKNHQNARPFHGMRALTQYPPFALAAAGSGNITAQADEDSLYRHVTLLTQIDQRFYPALSLAIFMDWAGITMADLMVDWGKSITLPATEHSFLDNDVVIPIDERGRTFIPYVDEMGKDFKQMSVHHFLTHFSDPDVRGNLLDFFEGNFVFIGDIAAGTSDLGYTPLEPDVPLITIHASMLNAMLTHTFYTEWPEGHTAMVMIAILLILTVAACFRSSLILYGTGALLLFLLPLFTWFEFIHFTLFPLATVFAAFLMAFSGLIIFLEISTAKDRTFIKQTFGRYVPETVVNTLLDRPELIELGGEERVASILFSDLVGFTTISERLSPQDLVTLLNEYFTEMTTIIMAHGGIIDKFQGDAIMAEFGIPVSTPHHADQAVSSALAMLQKLDKLRKQWKEKGIPELHCRIGINSGKMIVGNMGSDTAMDYTVMGDAVNLASRLEGANKYYGTELMISEFTLASLTPNRFKTRILDFVKVKGKEKAVKIYEVYDAEVFDTENIKDENQVVKAEGQVIKDRRQDIKGDTEEPPHGSHNNDSYYQKYDRAFNAYLDKRFRDAVTLFNDALRLRPDDPAASKMIHRIQSIETGEQSLVLQDWDGAVSLHSK